VIADKTIINEYTLFFSLLFLLWVFVGYFAGKYNKLKNKTFIVAILQTLVTAIYIYLFANILNLLTLFILSIHVVNTGITITLSIDLLYLVLYYGYKYAVDIEREIINYEDRKEHPVFEAGRLSDEDVANLEKTISTYTSKPILDYLKTIVDFGSTNTKVLDTALHFNIELLQNYRYDCIVNIHSLNDIGGINKMFCSINEKLSDNGDFILIFTPQRFLKERFLKRYPKGINYIFYFFYYLFRRVLPKLLLTSRFYFDITKSKNRVFSDTEVFGRLYYCGFKLIGYKTVDMQYIAHAQRKQQPKIQEKRTYGPFIALNRVGKNGEIIKVYKMRTMHPYSEFLQEYIYEKNDLQEGGKINNDVRITTLGRFMRKYWIDELPMVINLFKGNMKFVGVRPLSNHYFSLYSRELQEKRTKFKPGLLPPFYADMPKTLDEIQASEMRYLADCERNGIFKTDVRYFKRILVNILFRKARSK
jgi:lipopolysaccharide/colanic/teichoic acid biosynthesis glycosyltransferase